MMKSSLAYIGTAAANAVDVQDADPAAFADFENAERKIVAGISCYAEDPVAARRTALQAYRQDAEALKRKLAAADVSHLAILPSRAWDEIAKNAGLYRLVPDDSGSVLVHDGIIDAAAQRAHNALAWRPLAALLSGSAVAGVLMYSVLHAFGVGNPAVSVFTTLAAVAGGYLVSEVVDSVYFGALSARPSALAAKEATFIRDTTPEKKADLLAALFPQNAEHDGGVKLRIELPPAPMEAQENLMRAKRAGFELTLDTVGDAIGFPDDVAGALAGSREKHWAQKGADFKAKEDAKRAADARKRELDRERRRAMFDLDPVVTTRLGNAVAVIVQYGDFPIEQAVIDRVLNSTSLV